ncbi:unnamed protein product [Symbiodinium sp. CCMP2592]|nr:unnamed protein product [Symbiodinium sp. CCMP2592]
MGSEPDLDALFGPGETAEAAGATPESHVQQVHPALRSAVEALVAESWPRARAELVGAESGEQASKGARPPLPASLARDVDAALAAESCGEWADCRQKASAIRSEAWNALIRDKGWQRPCDKELFMLTELLLALCSHAAGSSSSAVKHADGVFVFAPAGEFRSCALLFVRLLDDDVRAVRAEEARPMLGQFPSSCTLETALKPKPSAQRLDRLATDPCPEKLKELLSSSPLARA